MREASDRRRITSYNVCYTKLLRQNIEMVDRFAFFGFVVALEQNNGRNQKEKKKYGDNQCFK